MSFFGFNDARAASTDESGAHLPSEHGPWTSLKYLLVDGDQPDEIEKNRFSIVININH